MLDPDPHQGESWTVSISTVYDKPKRIKFEPNCALFQDFEPLFGSYDLDPDPHQSERYDPDPDQVTRTIWVRINVTSRIRIRIKVMRIRNTEPICVHKVNLKVR
jgi:hypothetical protein